MQIKCVIPTVQPKGNNSRQYAIMSWGLSHGANKSCRLRKVWWLNFSWPSPKPPTISKVDIDTLSVSCYCMASGDPAEFSTHPLIPHCPCPGIMLSGRISPSIDSDTNSPLSSVLTDITEAARRQKSKHRPQNVSNVKSVWSSENICSSTDTIGNS